MQTEQHTTRSRWGRSKFGRGTAPALAVSAPIGLALAAAVAGAAVAIGFSADRSWLGMLVLGIALAGPMVALVWALCVDRSTIRGATERPEESVEGRWYDKAAAGAFHDVLTATGVGTAVIFLAGWQIEGSYALLGVVLLCMASCAIRYAIQRRKG